GADGPSSWMEAETAGYRMNAALTAVRAWSEAALGFFYPQVCQICRDGRAGPDEGYVCRKCWSRPGAIQFIVPPFCSRCGLPFEGEITTAFECSNCREL